MNFILDANISYEISEYLEASLPFEFLSIQKTNPFLEDEELLDLAVIKNAINITNDKDFGELVFRRQLIHRGILLLRIEELSYEEMKLLLLEILKSSGELLTNKFSVYQNGRIRIR
ncbi:MAG: DUF5615 family PIN-like protein [Chitinophagales bacterium]|nr:DUF5615 family PIN-like protein [Chitinophagales bacterium]